MRDLKARYGKTALVTGASAGIGAAYARELAARGLDLVLVARRAERLAALKEELERRYRGRIEIISCDLAEPGAAEEVRRQAGELGLEIDILINNAGFGSYGELWRTDLDRQRGMIDLHCRAVVELTYAFAPGMVARRRGAVIILSSVLGAMPAPYMAVYAATKAFDRSLGESLWGELHPHGVDTLAVLPTLTATEFQTGADHPPMPVRKRRAEDVVRTTFAALGRKPSVTDGPLAKLLLFIVSLVPRRWTIAAYGRFRKAP